MLTHRKGNEKHELDRSLRGQKIKKKALEAKIDALRAVFHEEYEELNMMSEEERKRQAVLIDDRIKMGDSRKRNSSATFAKRPKKKNERREK